MTTMRFAGTEAFNSGFTGSYGTYTTGSTINGYTYTGDTTTILESRYNTLQQSQAYEIGTAGNDAVMSSKIDKFTSYIENGEEDKALAAYQELLEQMKLQTRYSQLVTEDGDDTQLRAVARQLIESDAGVDLEELIRECTRDAKAVQKQQLYRGVEFCDSTTQEELLAETCDLEEQEGKLNCVEKAWHGLFGGIAKAWNSVFSDGKKH